MTESVSSNFTRGTGLVIGDGWGWIVVYGIVSMLFGLAALIWPFPATLAATFIVGFGFASSGIFSLIAGIRAAGSEGRTYTILLGIVSLIAGILMLVSPLTGAVSLTLMVAIWLLLRGAMEIALGFRMRRQRGLMLALGAVNVLLALFILVTVPFSALTLPGFILGVSFLFGGITTTLAGIDHRSGASAFTVSD